MIIRLDLQLYYCLDNRSDNMSAEGVVAADAEVTKVNDLSFIAAIFSHWHRSNRARMHACRLSLVPLPSPI
jgi:hypothetical protein